MFKLKEILEATGGSLLQGSLNATFKSISTDTRTTKPKELFLAIKGDNFNGHSFIKKAIEKQAGGAIVSENKKDHYPRDFVVILVDDTVKALADIARFHRNKFDIPVIAVTGSNGKTTTKDMITHILSKKYNVLSAEGTHNNHIGVPSTLLQLNSRHKVAILELGTNHKGEIRNLSKIAMPDIAVFTNIGPSHLEFFNNTAAVFAEKITLLKNLNSKGIIVINKDDHYLQEIDIKYKKRFKILSYGVKNSSKFQATKINLGFDSLEFLLNNKNWIRLNTPAEHNIYNALAAMACADIFKIDIAIVKRALENFAFPKSRFTFIRIKDFSLIDDSYNSNPLSLENAMKVISRYDSGRKILVCGDMLELGRNSKKLHYELGKKLKGYGIDVLITIGKLSKFMAKGALNKRLNNKMIFTFDSINRAANKLIDIIHSGDIILIKGSRLLKMERIVDQVKRQFI